MKVTDLDGRACAATVRLRRGTFLLDADLDVGAGEVVAVLGPNGSGKSTLMAVLSGLLAVDEGRVTIGGVVVDDPAADTFVRPEGRLVGVVFQDHLLFPNLDLCENVAFGPRSRGVRRDVAHRRAMSWLERFGIEAEASARPDAVSGGQAQRAALARALATDPALLLLDEPFSALDVSARTSLRRELRLHLADFGGATVLVTHDPLDALALADRLVVIESGRVTQSGNVADVMGSPRTPYIADLAGTNLLSGTAAGTEVELDLVAGAEERARLVVAEAHDGPVVVVIRPSSVTLHREEPTGSPRNRWAVTVTGLDPLGERVRIRLGGVVRLVAEVTPATVEEMDLRPGSRVWAAVKATDVAVHCFMERAHDRPATTVGRDDPIVPTSGDGPRR